MVPLEYLFSQSNDLFLLFGTVLHVGQLNGELVLEEHVSQSASDVEDQKVEEPLGVDLLEEAPGLIEDRVYELNSGLFLV